MKLYTMGLKPDTIKTKVYCANTKTLLGTFESRAEAARFAGVKPKAINKYVANRHRCRRNKLNTIICFR